MISVSFHTFGCKCNLSDSNDMALRLLDNGAFNILDSELKAEIHIINTCAVTASAESQARNLVRKLDKNNKDSLIIVSGCSRRRDRDVYEILFKELSANNKYLAFNNLEQDIFSQISKHLNVDVLNNKTNIISSVFRTRAFVKIQDGCESFCSYCIVPFVRGKEKSKGQEQIIDEINKLYSEGIKEIVLTGINIASYKNGLENLLKMILKDTKMPRIRLSSLRPSKLSTELLEIMTEKRICPHLHISLQSGSDKILRLMNRHDYSSADFKDSLERYYLALKVRSLFVAADVIVGFPEEDINDFKRTYDVINDSPVNKLHVFVFSPRPGTKALEMKNTVDIIEAKQRSAKLLELSDKKYFASLKNMVGKKVEVLWEDDTKGHSDNYYPISGQGIKNTLEDRTVLSADLENKTLIV